MDRTNHRLRVLVVDDSRDTADTLALLVQRWGFEVRTAYDGQSALAIARTEAPHCVISDINMPGLDGYELGSRFRADPGLAHAKLVALSACTADDHAEKVRDAGFDYSLTKPASPDALEEVLRMIEQVVSLAAQTKELARQNVSLAGQTKELIEEVKEDLREVKQDVKELKADVADLRANAD